MIKKILFITLSNIGDVILTLPILDYLRDNFPLAAITVMTGERPRDIFENNPHIKKVIVYDKRSRLREKIRLFNELKKEHFDMVIDLRNSFYGMFLPAKYRSAPFLPVPGILRHMKYRNLFRMLKFAEGRRWLPDYLSGKIVSSSPADVRYIDEVMAEYKINPAGKFVIISAGARSSTKRWSEDSFAEVASELIKEEGVKVILVGDKADIPISEHIARRLDYDVIDLTGKTTLTQLGLLLRKASLVITNDSAVAHLASYLNAPVLSIFGPTNELKYGPWSKVYSVVTKGLICRPCEKAECKFETLECLKRIRPADVLREAKFLLRNRRAVHQPLLDIPLKRILISRTDRIGDVVLSTPVIKVLREAYPYAYIAMMVSPLTKDIVEGNPFLDEVIVYDKDNKHKSWLANFKFCQHLRKKGFDLAILLHPTNRVHLVTFFSGIRQRLGYDRKLGLLLNRRLKHTKQLGEKHELEYNLDLLRALGIPIKDKSLFVPLKPESEWWAMNLFRKEGLRHGDRILGLHPGASCPSKIWPAERFAQVADRLAGKSGFKIVLVAGPRDEAIANKVAQSIHHPVLNLAGKTSITQLASLLKRCTLFISNDSGPVHIASGLGVPVISIFGRSDKGLGPKRWGPLGKNDKFLHKDIGCVDCLAHNCIKEFACLKAISVDDVVNLAEEILK